MNFHILNDCAYAVERPPILEDNDVICHMQKRCRRQMIMRVSPPRRIHANDWDGTVSQQLMYIHAISYCESLRFCHNWIYS